MPSSLTSTKIKNTYGQILHVDGGVTTTPKTVYDGDGTATALKVSTTAIEVPALTLSGGVANGVPYLNGSKVLTTGSVLTFDGTSLGIGTSSPFSAPLTLNQPTVTVLELAVANARVGRLVASTAGGLDISTFTNTPISFSQNNSEQMRLTSTGLGIGTSSPSSYSAKLAVVGAANSNATVAFRTNDPTVNNTAFNSIIDLTGTAKDSGGVVRYNNTTIEALGSTSNGGVIVFKTDDSSANLRERMRIDASGNLGLGVTPSAWEAGYKAFEFGYNSLSSASNATMSLCLNGYFSGGWKYKNTGNSNLYSQNNGGGHAWHIAPSGTAGNAISFTQALTLDANGNLLIGTTTAGASKLVVNSDSIQVNTAKTPASATATGTTGQIAWDANYMYVCVATNTWKRSAIATW